MTCEELRPEHELFALGLAAEPELSELREHLRRNCENCTPGVRQARERLALLALTAPEAEPPARLRRRILAGAGVESGSRLRLVPLAVAAAACVFALALVIYSGSAWRRQTAALGRTVRDQRAALALLNAPATRRVTFGEGQPAPPRGNVFVNPAAGVLLLASNLPKAPAGKTYEMWVIPKSGKPAPAGLFDSQPDGTAMHLFAGPVDLEAAGAVAVTLEPAGGVPQPTSTPLIVAAL